MLTATPKLLARFEIFHNAPTPSLAVGDTFTIGLINNDWGTPELDDDSTFFSDSTLTALTFADGSNPTAFTNSGVITITSAAVPEPGTFAVLAIAAASFCGHRLRRAKSQSASHDSHIDFGS